MPCQAVSLAGGISAAAQSLVLVIANPLVGRVVDRTWSYTLPILALTAWILPGCIAWIAWDPRPQALRSSQRIAPST